MLGITKDIHVVYNFVNEKEYNRKELPRIKKGYGIAENEKVLIHISNFRKVKRVQDVIQTFYKINKQIDAKLLLVGEGPEYSSANQLVDTLGLNDHVLFLGKQKNISDLLSISDLKLLLSEKESFGLVLLEAMACEVPCIGTNVGGIPEVIEHNETGFIVDVGDTDKACEFAVQLLQDPTLLKQFSQNAYRRARKCFHSERIVEQYKDLYEHVLETNSD